MIEATCQTRDFNIKATKNKNRSLKHILITKEILYMKGFDDRLGLILSFLIQEREGFVEQPAADKIRDVARQIEQLVDEISFRWEILFPVTCNTISCSSIHKLTSLAHLVEEKLDLESFKFCFTVASSLIAELLEKYRHQKRSLRHFVHQLVSAVQNEAIEDCLLSLGLYEPSQASGHPRRPLASRSEATSGQVGFLFLSSVLYK